MDWGWEGISQGSLSHESKESWILPIELPETSYPALFTLTQLSKSSSSISVNNSDELSVVGCNAEEEPHHRAESELLELYNKFLNAKGKPSIVSDSELFKRMESKHFVRS
jgi:hypothetical protein